MFSFRDILVLISMPKTAIRVIKSLVVRALIPSSRRNNFSEAEYTRIATKKNRKKKTNQKICIAGEIKTVSWKEWTEKYEPLKFQEIAQLVSKSVVSDAKLRVLELGVGQGRTLNYLKTFTTELGLDISWFGCDLTFARLFNFNETPSLPIRLANADGCYLPYPDGFFDFVYTHHVLEQIPRDFGNVILEGLRVGKRFMAMEPCFEHANLDGKVNMIIKDHVIRLEKFFAKTTPKYNLVTPQASAKAKNPTMYFLCDGLPSSEIHENSQNPYVCPTSREPLLLRDNMLINQEETFGYPIVRNIPILKPSFRFDLTKTKLQNDGGDFANKS